MTSQQCWSRLPGSRLYSMQCLSKWVRVILLKHYCDVIMSAKASQITSVSIVCSIVGAGADQRKHQSSASLAFVWVIHRWSVNSPHKRPVTRKCFHLMTSSYDTSSYMHITCLTDILHIWGQAHIYWVSWWKAQLGIQTNITRRPLSFECTTGLNNMAITTSVTAVQLNCPTSHGQQHGQISLNIFPLSLRIIQSSAVIIGSSWSQFYHRTATTAAECKSNFKITTYLALHYNNVIMGAIASQITSLTIVYSSFIQGQIKANIKAPRHWPLCGEFTGVGDFPAQLARTAENVFICWRHNVRASHGVSIVRIWEKIDRVLTASHFIYIKKYRLKTNARKYKSWGDVLAT